MTGDEVTKETMCGAQFSDIEVASRVRMQMRTDLNHESVCVMGRDRIMYLSQRVEKLERLASELINMDFEDFENLDQETMHHAFDLKESDGFLNDGRS